MTTPEKLIDIAFQKADVVADALAELLRGCAASAAEAITIIYLTTIYDRCESIETFYKYREIALVEVLTKLEPLRERAPEVAALAEEAIRFAAEECVGMIEQTLGDPDATRH